MVTIGVVKCLATAHASSDVIADALSTEITSRTKVVTLPQEERVQLCGELGTDAAVSTWSSDWNLGKTIASPLARSTAKSANAGSVLIPLIRTNDACDPSTGCKELSVDVGLFLFSADGLLLWKGTAKQSVPDEATTTSNDANRLAWGVLSDLPADFTPIAH